MSLLRAPATPAEREAQQQAKEQDERELDHDSHLGESYLLSFQVSSTRING